MERGFEIEMASDPSMREEALRALARGHRLAMVEAEKHGGIVQVQERGVMGWTCLPLATNADSTIRKKLNGVFTASPRDK